MKPVFRFISTLTIVAAEIHCRSLSLLFASTIHAGRDMALTWLDPSFWTLIGMATKETRLLVPVTLCGKTDSTSFGPDQ